VQDEDAAERALAGRGGVVGAVVVHAVALHEVALDELVERGRGAVEGVRGVVDPDLPGRDVVVHRVVAALREVDV